MDEAAWRAVFKELFEMSEMNFRFKGSPVIQLLMLFDCSFAVFATAKRDLCASVVVDLRRQRTAVQLRDEPRFGPSRALKIPNSQLMT